ncbi:CASP8 and FADD-like apoptosis regulator a [Brachyhypopomus gauderio]|uniref:CASP8 and FADD-like apoptosis regulator a n=1 Tax=Brachyhypopomus gauderio TaxID=698409 RepID=UPI0040415685
MADRFSILVNNVVDALSKEEQKTLLYLCSDLTSGERMDDLQGALLLLGSHAHTHTGQPHPGDSILKELLFQVKRFDILRRILGTSKQEVERRLGQGRILSKYRVLMMELSDSLDTEELKSFIFLMRSTVPKSSLDRATSFLDVVMELEKMDEVSCEKLGLVEQCLKSIQRADLAKRVQQFQKGQHVQVSQHTVQIGTQSGLGPSSQQYGHPQALKTLKFSVPESEMQHIQATGDDYNINCEHHGFCVIIDCIGYDGVLMKHTFEQLGFQVFLHTMLSAQEMYAELRRLSQERDLQRAAAFACCLLSRGSHTHLLATDPCGPGLLLPSLLELFSPVHCPLLRGKPKLFFTQSYIIAENQPGHVQYDQYLETDSVPFRGVPRSVDGEDVLWSMCKTGAWLLETPHQSVYLQALSSALLQAHTRRLHILDALIKMNRDVLEHNLKNPDQIYTITLSHTLQKHLYL